MKINYIAVLLILATLSSCQQKKTIAKQNVILILVDDLGWSDLNCMGSNFHETPNINALSKQSLLFTNAYASSSVCSPSRAAILTGKHPARIGITDWIPGLDPKGKKLKGPEDLNQLPLEEVTIAEIFKNNGYSTCHIGKWHLGDTGFFPEQQGFDKNIGGFHKGSPQAGYYSPYKNPKLPDGPYGEYLTDRLTHESIKFIESNKKSPFFLNISFYSVHTPIQPNLKHIKKFELKRDLNRINTKRLKREGLGQTNLIQNNAAYASMIYSLDENIGKIIKALKNSHLFQNTTIILTSDNGGLSTLLTNKNLIAPTSNLPLRAGKGWLYEGGIRVPLLIKPAKFKNKQKTITNPVIGHDLFPTILSIAKIPNTKLLEFDGVDISPLFYDSTINRQELIWHYPHYHGSGWTPGAAIRKDNWKLIEFHETYSVELYDLNSDLSESIDLSKKHPKKTIALQKRLHNLLDSLKAKSATLNKLSE